jgi:predicted alpha/beta-hydrolase family hydrolase
MPHDTLVRIPAAGALLEADLVMPPGPAGVVLFAHGSGSSRQSPRNRSVADRLHERGLATLLTDLLTPRGGRADLAGQALAEVRAPTLLIVGGADETVLTLNQQAAAAMAAPTALRVVPGASHLFPEPGALEQVSTWAGEWFTAHLGTGRPHA